METLIIMGIGALLSDIVVLLLLAANDNLRNRVAQALIAYGSKPLAVEANEEFDEGVDNENF